MEEEDPIFNAKVNSIVEKLRQRNKRRKRNAIVIASWNDKNIKCSSALILSQNGYWYLWNSSFGKKVTHEDRINGGVDNIILEFSIIVEVPEVMDLLKTFKNKEDEEFRKKLKQSRKYFIDGLLERLDKILRILRSEN
ncbi:MAG: hypothetical protein WCW87_04195 [Candidatus Paceibacterota bacterium]